MDQMSRAAYIIAMSACLGAEIAAMQIENQIARDANVEPPHTGDDMRRMINQYGVHHNAVIGYLRQ